MNSKYILLQNIYLLDGCKLAFSKGKGGGIRRRGKGAEEKEKGAESVNDTMRQNTRF